ncbi:MAG: T9SS type A sorting domain-containing protein [Saprospiraceae bacterium]|nr:T9SS type A sorting domain-containing protein [Saprospiraceae bacterium]
MVEVILVGTEDPEWLNSFRLYPNPNDGSFNIDMVGEPIDEVSFTLYDAAGRLIKRDVSDFNTGVLRKSFLYQGLPSGMYHMHILAGAKSKHVKIVVQR